MATASLLQILPHSLVYQPTSRLFLHDKKHAARSLFGAFANGSGGGDNQVFRPLAGTTPIIHSGTNGPRASSELMITLVSHGSVLFEGGLELADVAAHTRFRIGSVTKTFVAAGLLQLTKQSKLRLDNETCELPPKPLSTTLGKPPTPCAWCTCWSTTPASTTCTSATCVCDATPTDSRGPAALAVFRGELRCC